MHARERGVTKTDALAQAKTEAWQEACITSQPGRIHRLLWTVKENIGPFPSTLQFGWSYAKGYPYKGQNAPALHRGQT